MTPDDDGWRDEPDDRRFTRARCEECGEDYYALRHENTNGCSAKCVKAYAKREADAETMALAAPCPKCKTAAHVGEMLTEVGRAICCTDCYDVDCEGDGYFSYSIVAQGLTLTEAVADWNAKVEEAA